MLLLFLGVLLWTAAHLFKRILPDGRAALEARLGPGSRGVIALALLGSIVLMVLGYRAAEFTPVYDPPGWGIHASNLLMLIAVIFLGMGNSKGRARTWFRHPMLMGFSIWAVAHLLVRGDLASIILWGGLLLWAVVEIPLINAKEGPWDRPEPGPPAGDVKLLVISAVVFAVLAGIHSLVGPWPFPGG